MSQLGGGRAHQLHLSIITCQNRSQQQHATEKQQTGGSGLLHNPSLLQAAKMRLCKEIPSKQQQQQQKQQQHHQIQQRRNRFRSADVAPLAPPPLVHQQQQQQQQQQHQLQQHARRGIDDLCDSVCSTLSDCSILRSGRFPGGSIGCSETAAASGDLAAALRRLRAARSASASASGAANPAVAGAPSANDAELQALLQHSLRGSSLTALVRTSVESLSHSRSYSRHELLTVLRRLSQAHLAERLLPQLLERLESTLLHRMLATGLLQADGDAYFRCSGRQRHQASGASVEFEASRSPAPVPKLRAAGGGTTGGHCSAGRPPQPPSQQQQQQQQQNRVTSRYFINSSAQQQQQQHGVRSSSSSAGSRWHQPSLPLQPSLFLPPRSQEPSQLDKDQQQVRRRSTSVRSRPPRHPVGGITDSIQQPASTVTATQAHVSGLRQHQQNQTAAVPSNLALSTQQFVVRDNRQLRAALVDPEDRRINSIGQRHGCLITVQDRTRRLGHNAHRVIVCAPNDKALSMCARALDKAMGWDLNSQLAYARCRTRTAAAAAGDANGPSA